ncbi:mediator of RNA polymerase II transcription subunit 5 [Diutina catenulata]
MSYSELARVVEKASAKRIPAKTFIGLINQISARRQIPDGEFTTGVIEVSQRPEYKHEATHIELVLQLAVSDDSRLDQFCRCLPAATLNTQIRYLRAIEVTPQIKQSFLFGHFPTYVQTMLNLISTSTESTSDITGYLNTLVLIMGTWYRDVELTTSMREILANLVRICQQFGLTDLVRLVTDFERSANQGSIPTAIEAASISHASHPAAARPKNKGGLALIPGQSSRYLRWNRCKMFYWIEHRLRSWHIDRDPQRFLQSYTSQFVDPAHQKDGEFIAGELMRSYFIAISFFILNNELRYVIFNLKNFIVSMLPKIMSLASADKMEQVVTTGLSQLPEELNTTLSTMTVGKQKQYDLRQAFVKACVLNKSMSIHSFQKLFPFEKNQSLVNELSQANAEVNFMNKLNEKLIHVNTEFTSLDESGLFAYIDSLVVPLEFSAARQQEFSDIVLQVVDQFVASRSTNKLYRLLMSLLNNLAMLNIVCYNVTPEALVGKLIDYIDGYDFPCDDDNFQDQYSHFGVLLVAIIVIADFFDYDVRHYTIKNSFVIDYINNFYLRLGTNMAETVQPSGDEETTIITNYNHLFASWVNALFDDANDGLSDDLIKSISVKQIYKLIPVVYQQAITATHAGEMDFATLSTGLEYLTQGFLVPCTVSIIRWLSGEISLHRQVDSVHVRVLEEVFKAGCQSDDAASLFRLVITATGASVMSTLKSIDSWESSAAVKNVIFTITQNLDLGYLDSHSLGKLEVPRTAPIPQTLRNVWFFSVVNVTMSLAPLNFRFLLDYAATNVDDIVHLVLDEVDDYLKNSSEDTKLFINLCVSCFIIYSVNSAEEKAYWQRTLSGPAVAPQESAMLMGGEASFTLHIDRHYSSIFNEKKADDMFDDMIEDDDLFSDEKRRVPTSASLRTLQDLRRQKCCYLAAIQRLRSSISLSSRHSKPLAMIIDRAIDELSCESL